MSHPISTLITLLPADAQAAAKEAAAASNSAEGERIIALYLREFRKYFILYACASFVELVCVISMYKFVRFACFFKLKIPYFLYFLEETPF